MVPSTYPCHADLSSTALRAHRPAGPVHAHRRRAHPCAIVPSSLNIPPPDCVASRGRVPTQVALASGRKQESRPAGVSRREAHGWPRVRAFTRARRQNRCRSVRQCANAPQTASAEFRTQEAACAFAFAAAALSRYDLPAGWDGEEVFWSLLEACCEQ